jgi:hypothetical protein
MSRHMHGIDWEQPTVMVDPETGEEVGPNMHGNGPVRRGLVRRFRDSAAAIFDDAPSCRGDCRQKGAAACPHPNECKFVHTLHRVVEITSHPSDAVLRSKTIDELAREDARVIGQLVAVIAVLIVALFAWTTLVAGLPVFAS